MAQAFEPVRPPEFPSWPMHCLTLYRRLAEDYGRYVEALGGVTDVAQAARAKADYGVSLMGDLAQAWYDLALSPFTAMLKTMGAAEAVTVPPAAPASSSVAMPAKAAE